MGHAQSKSLVDKGPFTDDEYDRVVQAFDKRKDANTDRMPEAAFLQLFQLEGEPCFAPGLYCVFKNALKVEEDPADDPHSLSFTEFFQQASNCSRSSDKNILKTFFKVMDEDHDGQLQRNKVYEFFRVGHALSVAAKGYSDRKGRGSFNAKTYQHQLKEISLAAEFSSSDPADGIPMPECGNTCCVDFDEFYVWASQTVPLLYQCFGSFIYSRICQGLPLPASLDFRLPNLRQKSCILEGEAELFNLALAGPSLQGSWERLYTSETNGLSFNRICHYILGYRGPNLIVLRDSKGYVFGFYTSESWRESNTYYGSSDCFLFRVAPDFVISRPKCSSNNHFQYLNLKGYSLPHGLGVGGTVEGFRLFVPESLESCVGGAACPTFEYGPLASSKVFDLEAMEVWGVGGEEVIQAASSAQGQARQVMAENLDKARKVDKAKLCDSDFDKEMFFGKTFGGGSRAGDNRADR